MIINHDLDTSLALLVTQPIDTWKNAVQTILKLLSNLIKQPENDKYRRIRLGNPVFQSK